MKVFGQQLQLCHIAIGDPAGKPVPCFQLAEMPVRIEGMKVQACRNHAQLIKQQRYHAQLRVPQTTVPAEGAD